MYTMLATSSGPAGGLATARSGNAACSTAIAPLRAPSGRLGAPRLAHSAPQHTRGRSVVPCRLACRAAADTPAASAAAGPAVDTEPLVYDGVIFDMVRMTQTLRL